MKPRRPIFYTLDPITHATTPCDLPTAALQLEEGGESLRRVALTIIPEAGVEISTVFLGIDHAFGDGPPLLFESLIYSIDGGDSERDCFRYSSWWEAEEGHWRLVAKYSAPKPK
jgi:hypothetical protein